MVTIVFKQKIIRRYDDDCLYIQTYIWQRHAGTGIPENPYYDVVLTI